VPMWMIKQVLCPNALSEAYLGRNTTLYDCFCHGVELCTEEYRRYTQGSIAKERRKV
jgi:hypothetical protein